MHHKLFLSVTQLNRYLVTFELFSFKKKLNNSDSFKHFIALKHFKFLTLHSMYMSLSKSKETESDAYAYHLWSQAGLLGMGEG